MSNDFASLLSVFRDATSSSTSGGTAAAGRGPSNSSAVAQKKPHPQHQPSSSSVRNSKTNNEIIDPTSSKDPNFSAQLLKERIERILRIQQIRKSTATTGTCCKNDDRKSIHIAICATIVDEFPHEAIWRKWMDETGGECILDGDGSSSSGSGSSASEIAKASSEESKNRRIMTTAEMYIHAKNPERIRSEWLRSKTLPITHRPNWNDVRIVRAILSLLEAALSDDKTTHILLCTESCIPVATLVETAGGVLLDEVCIWEEEGEDVDQKKRSSGENGIITRQKKQYKRNNGLNWDQSYVDCYDRKSSRCTRFDEHNCWDILKDSVPGEAIHKALPGWCFLSRKHAQSILNIPSQLEGMNLWPAFERVWAPEEVFIPTALAICGHLDDEEVSRRALTHSQWDERAKNHKDRAHPISYDGCFDDELVSRVRRDGCLFMRKLKKQLDVNVWEKIVVQHKRGQITGTVHPEQEMKRGGDWEIDGGRRGRGQDRDMHRYHGRGERNDRSYQPRTGHDQRNYESRRRYDNDNNGWKRGRDGYYTSQGGPSKRQNWRR